MSAASQTTADAALSEDWLSRFAKIAGFHASLRDKFEPGKPLWITETADAAWGGNPWASTFLDSFRYLSNTLALRNVESRSSCTTSWRRATTVCSTRTLWSLAPTTGRPCYGHKLMDTTVLDPQVTVAPKRAQKRTSFLIRQLNVRTFDEDVRKSVLAAIERIVNVEAEASRAPKKPEITPLDRYSVHGHNRSRCLELLRWVPLRNRGRHRPRYLRSVLTFWLARKLHAS